MIPFDASGLTLLYALLHLAQYKLFAVRISATSAQDEISHQQTSMKHDVEVQSVSVLHSVQYRCLGTQS